MKRLLGRASPARGIIAVSLVGSVVLGAPCWSRSIELRDMREDLDARVKPTVAELMESARTHSKLSSRVRSDEFRDFETYLRRVAAQDKVEIGDVDLSPSEVPLAKGIVDSRYHVRPKERDRGFSRLTLTNFLSELENGRVQVTSVKIENAEKRSKPEAVPDDVWTFEADVTSRQRKLD